MRSTNRPRRLIARATTGAALALAALAITAPGAHAGPVCGQTVTSDLTLTSDLLDCPGDGLVVGANGIKIDLDGHRIDGTKTADSVGIDNPGFDDVVVKGGRGGRVTGFDVGVQHDDNSVGGSIRGIKVKNCGAAGVRLDFSTETKAKNNRVVGSIVRGITVRGERNRVLDNEIEGPADSPVGNEGILVSHSTSDDNLIKRNDVNQPDGTGILVTGAGPSATRIINNSFKHSGSDGIAVIDSSVNTVIKRNRVNRNGGNGIRISDSAGAGTKLLDNRAHRNTLDGIGVDRANSSIGDNRANHNGVWGLEVTAFVFNLGGNTAQGNGQAQQCSGISCGP